MIAYQRSYSGITKKSALIKEEQNSCKGQIEYFSSFESPCYKLGVKSQMRKVEGVFEKGK